MLLPYALLIFRYCRLILLKTLYIDYDITMTYTRHIYTADAAMMIRRLPL